MASIRMERTRWMVLRLLLNAQSARTVHFYTTSLLLIKQERFGTILTSRRNTVMALEVRL